MKWKDMYGNCHVKVRVRNYHHCALMDGDYIWMDTAANWSKGDRNVFVRRLMKMPTKEVIISQSHWLNWLRKREILIQLAVKLRLGLPVYFCFSPINKVQDINQRNKMFWHKPGKSLQSWSKWERWSGFSEVSVRSSLGEEFHFVYSRQYVSELPLCSLTTAGKHCLMPKASNSLWFV